MSKFFSEIIHIGLKLNLEATNFNLLLYLSLNKM
jgi:hypothetical protein